MNPDNTITPAALLELLSHECTLVDVREPAEWAQEHIAGAMLIPLGQLSTNLRKIPEKPPVILMCGTGKRSERGRRTLSELGRPDIWSLEGGIDAWKAAGLPTLQPPSPPLSIQRQWQIVAGTGILAGVALSLWVDPRWVLLSAFFGAGLLFAGISGHCGMAMLLSRMPWNRPEPAIQGRKV